MGLLFILNDQSHSHTVIFTAAVEVKRPTQPSIPPGSINEYQLRRRLAYKTAVLVFS